MTTLSLIIPSYNEVENLMILEKKLAKVFANKNDIEIIIVDNGSQDDTPKVLEKIIKKTTLKTLRSIRVDQNKGYGFGILAGCDAAKGDLIAWTHADLQTDPADILVALDCFETAKEPLTFVKGKRKKRPLLDTFFTIGMQYYASLILGVALNDINAQPKLFSREFYNNFILGQAPHDFSLDLYALYCAQKNNYTILTIPVVFSDRIYGEAKGGGSLKTKYKLIKRTFAYIHELAKTLNRDKRG